MDPKMTIIRYLLCYIIHFHLQVLTIPDFLKLFCSLAAVSINFNNVLCINSNMFSNSSSLSS